MFDDAWKSLTCQHTSASGSCPESTMSTACSSCASSSLDGSRGSFGSSYCSGAADEEHVPEIHPRLLGSKAYAKSQRSRADAKVLVPAFDPRDYNWCPPDDEDRPWESWPSTALGVPVRDRQSILQVAPRLFHAHLVGIEDGGKTSKAEAASCSICCADSDSLQGFAAFACGSHFYCSPCLSRYLRERLSMGMIPRCPEEGCEAQATFALCQRLLEGVEWESYLLMILRKTKRLQECPVCSSCLFIEPEADGGSSSATCSACRHRICRSCGQCWHASATCGETKERLQRRRRRAASRSFEELSAMLGLKRCPSCSSACEKSDPAACDHMTCVRCSFEFCWECSADRSVIIAHGNHYHLPGCRHYRPFADAAPEYDPKACQRCRKRERPCTPPPQVLPTGITAAGKANTAHCFPMPSIFR